jgi:two-component system, chemotaxis family, chemotaxis protein CheY
MKVLIADDSLTIRMMLKSLLKQIGITDVAEAGDGAQALEVVGRGSIDLMLLDLHMPQLDGLGCLAELRKQPATARLPVVIVSSDASPEQMAHARELGVTAYIRKPFRIEALREALAAAVERPATQKPASA